MSKSRLFAHTQKPMIAQNIAEKNIWFVPKLVSPHFTKNYLPIWKIFDNQINQQLLECYAEKLVGVPILS